MHIIINNNFLSLESILLLTDITDNPDGDWFAIKYMNAQEVYFYHKPKAPEDGIFQYRAFYFKSKESLKNTRQQILNILIDAAKSWIAG